MVEYGKLIETDEPENLFDGSESESKLQDICCILDSHKQNTRWMGETTKKYRAIIRDVKIVNNSYS
jgi:hypothetical protein